MSDPPAAGSHRGQRFWRRLRDAVASAVVGGEDALRLLAIAALADGHALVEDVPGTVKATLALRYGARARGGVRRAPSRATVRPRVAHPVVTWATRRFVG